MPSIQTKILDIYTSLSCLDRREKNMQHLQLEGGKQIIVIIFHFLFFWRDG